MPVPLASTVERIPIGKEELVGIVTLDFPAPVRDDQKATWETMTTAAWDFSYEADKQEYAIYQYAARADLNEWDRLGRSTREVTNLLWNRLPPLGENQARIYFEILAGPLDNDVGDALVLELNPLRLSPIDDSKPGARRPLEEIRVFRLLRFMWGHTSVVNAIFAAFDWGASFPYLKEKKCSLEEMLSDLYHWFDWTGRWDDKTYYLEK